MLNREALGSDFSLRGKSVIYFGWSAQIPVKQAQRQVLSRKGGGISGRKVGMRQFSTINL